MSSLNPSEELVLSGLINSDIASPNGMATHLEVQDTRLSNALDLPKQCDTSADEMTFDKGDSKENDSLDTDTKLAILISSLDEKTAMRLSTQELLEVLIRANGSVQKARTMLESYSNNIVDDLPSKRLKTNSGQKLLTDFIRHAVSETTLKTPSLDPSSAEKSMVEQRSHSVSRTSLGAVQHKRRPEKPLALFDPAQISELTPCTLHTSFLPSDLANEILQELLLESKSFPPKGSKETRFTLFGGEKEVWSRHTSGFFVRKKDTLEQEWAEGRGGYLYNGISAEHTGVRTYTAAMEKATTLVETKVNSLITARWKSDGRKPYESPVPWTTNAAFVNCYDGGGENVGWHTDQLTYLGPMTTIAGLSLGVGREFAIRKAGSTKDKDLRVFKIWLPHNSLLIMHAGTQEEWKHRYFAQLSTEVIYTFVLT